MCTPILVHRLHDQQQYAVNRKFPKFKYLSIEISLPTAEYGLQTFTSIPLALQQRLYNIIYTCIFNS